MRPKILSSVSIQVKVCWPGYMFWIVVGSERAFNSSIAVGAVIMTGADNIMNRTDDRDRMDG